MTVVALILNRVVEKLNRGNCHNLHCYDKIVSKGIASIFCGGVKSTHRSYFSPGSSWRGIALPRLKPRFQISQFTDTPKRHETKSGEWDTPPCA